MSLTIVVRGEEELGPQRLCVGCRQWWPPTFFPPWARPQRCNACVLEARAAREARAVASAAAEVRKRRNARLRPRWRAWQRRWRSQARAWDNALSILGGHV